MAGASKKNGQSDIEVILLVFENLLRRHHTGCVDN